MPRATTNTSHPSGTSRRLRAVPDTTATPAAGHRTDAEDSLCVALYDQPNSTAAQLALAAGIGRSTAGKILAAWVKDGSVTRTPGTAQGGRRVADRWAITEADDHPTPDVDNTGQGTPADSAIVVPEDTDSETDTGPNDDPGGPVTDDQPAESPIAATDTGEAITPPVAEDTAGPTGQPAQQSTVDGMESEPVTTASGMPDVTGHEVPTGLPVKAPRLGKGALRGMVEDFLTEHPGEQFSPNKIGKELGRSAGAVFNALEKLVASGWALRTSDAPKRYTAKPDTDISAPADTATDPAATDARADAAQPVG